ncbi:MULTISPECIES: putative adhesin [Acidocella]|uniref:putative adhesin n=1 Tax=Acidocella TaxID=50709 RepID=UPI00028E55EC|nr:MULTISPECIES: hypothetical protein [Acidocella]EKM99738.1 hypothetical protein MXAZACID_08851 [Acidocella sp. MX-AZ02]WBO58381.1 hypothetical protein GT370_14385 [Acidocella sp. MX-AZ03]
MPFWKSKPKTKPLTISGPIGSDRLAGTTKRVIFAGHGSFNTITDKNFPKVRLPPNITMVFWCLHGEELLDSIGSFIESHEDVNGLPDYLSEAAERAGYSKKVPEIVPGGSEIWNYRLTYPSGLSLGNKPANIPSSKYNPAINPASPAKTPPGIPGDKRYVVMPPLSGDIKDRGVPIIALLAANWNICDGAVVHWCACRSIVAR